MVKLSLKSKNVTFYFHFLLLTNIFDKKQAVYNFFNKNCLLHLLSIQKQNKIMIAFLLCQFTGYFSDLAQSDHIKPLLPYVWAVGVQICQNIFTSENQKLIFEKNRYTHFLKIFTIFYIFNVLLFVRKPDKISNKTIPKYLKKNRFLFSGFQWNHLAALTVGQKLKIC